MPLHNVFHYLGIQDVADLVERVRVGDPDDLLARADACTSAATTLDRAADDTEAAAAQLSRGWAGQAADAAHRALLRAADARHHQGMQLHQSSSAFATVADALREVQRVGVECLARADALSDVLDRLIDQATDMLNTTVPLLGAANWAVEKVTGVDLEQTANQFLASNLGPIAEEATGVLDRMEAAIAAYESVLREQAEVLRTMPGVVRADAGPIDLPGDAELRQGALFRAVYGRDPVGAQDLLMARALDVQGPDGGNTDPNAVVTVVRIEPVPGAGVVHGSAFISQPGALNPADPSDPLDLGDGRGFNPSADPSDGRVTFDIDYETGVVVVRQNASHSALGQASVGHPDVGVEQAADGSVRVRIDATDPLGGPIATDARGSVRADLVIDPNGGTSAADINGKVTRYPAWEVYQDRSGTTGDPLLQRPEDDLPGYAGTANLGRPTVDVGEDPSVLTDWRDRYHPDQQSGPLTGGFSIPSLLGDDFYRYPVHTQPYPSADGDGRLVVPHADPVR